MARSRTLKPGFFQNEYLAELEPLARLLFEGLWCIADRDGRLEDRPKKIKVEILPYDNCDVDKLLNNLANAKEPFIVRYIHEEVRYIQITNFPKHQNPHPKEPESSIPAYSEKSRVIKFLVTENKFLVSDSSNRIKGLKECKEEVIDSVELQKKSGDEKPKKEPVKIPYDEIVNYLNEHAKTKYKSTTKATRELIDARTNEGFSLEDFKTVINNKCIEWLETDQEKYLRPETLFCAKHFESYQNQKAKPPSKPQNGKPTFNNFTNRTYDAKALEEAWLKKSKGEVSTDEEIKEAEERLQKAMGKGKDNINNPPNSL